MQDFHATGTGMTASPLRIAIYLPDLSGGGAERLHIELSAAWREAGHAPRFLLDRREGTLLDDVPSGVPVDALDARRQLAALPKLIRYLRHSRPDVLIANTEHMNIMAVAARALARVPTKIIVTQHNSLSEQVKRLSWKWRSVPALYRQALPRADAVVAVSAGVADDLSAVAGFPRERVTVITNGVVSSDFDRRAAEEPGSAWLQGATPVLLAIGRLVPQKDHATLIRAFAIVARECEARLVILGEGPLRGKLESLVTHLGLQDRVSLPGFITNPLPWLRRARLLVHPSRFEGFGNVIAEALACGTPVVSTDCPYGPADILEHGRFGDLVPVGDPAAMASAILRAIVAEPDRPRLRERGRSFDVAGCAERYGELFVRLAAS